MLPKRAPLGQISGNISKRRQLTPLERAEIIGASKCGVKPSQIAKDLSFNPKLFGLFLYTTTCKK